MNKVTIPAAVADVIENLREGEYDNEGILTEVLADDIHLLDVSTLRSIPFDTLLSALVNGYEREKTEADRHAELRTTFSFYHGEGSRVADGILITLDILGITVAGINDSETEVPENDALN